MLRRLSLLIPGRCPEVPRSQLDREAVDRFHQLWYHRPDTWAANTFLGRRILQNPLDLQLYQEMITRTRPPFILQTGISGGGSLLYFASLFDLLKADASAVVVGVDVRISAEARTLDHPRIRMVEGNSTDPATVDLVRSLLPARRGMVSLDSDHSEAHVSKELTIYPDFVEVGHYLVIEDTNINGHPVLERFGPGPMESVRAFLARDDRFEQDNGLWGRNLFSFHQYGWLRRVR